MHPWTLLRSAACSALALCLLAVAHAQVGLTTLPPAEASGPVTVFYPTAAPAGPVHHGRLSVTAALDAAPQPGNGRLVVISHGSGGGPWVHADLARALVQAGYVVAFPEHARDNNRDDSRPGPESWTLRPAEVSRAIDAMAADPRFAPLLKLDKVGLYGMSAGGHTALSLAGGRWSPAGFKRHCQAHIEEDFPFCVGLATHLTGSWLDGVRIRVARAVIAWKFDDERLREDHDPRIAVVVAAVPAAADFELASLAMPRVPLGLVTAQQDRWLAPRFHGNAVLQACKSCERVADLPDGGHGALLSPLPPGLTGIEGELLNDPPGFDRSRLPEVDRSIVAYFGRWLLAPVPARPADAPV